MSRILEVSRCSEKRIFCQKALYFDRLLSTARTFFLVDRRSTRTCSASK